MIRACRGFSLLEVLVAFVILALTVGVLMRIFSVGLNNIGTTEQYTRAVALAESKLAEVGVTSPLGEGESTGDDGQGDSWHVLVHPYDSGASVLEGAGFPVGLYQVDVTVRWEAAPGTTRSVHLSSLRLGPRQ